MKRRYPPRSQRTTNWAARRPAQGLGYVVVRMAPLALIALAVIFDQVTPANWPFNRFLEGLLPWRPRVGALSAPA